MRMAADGLGRALGVRPDEGGRLLGVATLFALLEAGRALGEVGKDTLIQGRFGPTGELPVVMPLLYIGLGTVGLVVALLWPWIMGLIVVRRTRQRRQNEIDQEVQKQLAQQQNNPPR